MSKLYAAGLTLALALSGEAFSQQGVTTRMVTATGWPAPGMGAGIVFEKFGTPSTNEFGRVALRGWLDGPGTTVETEQGIWHEPTRGNLVLNIVAGQQAAGAPAGVQEPSPF